MQNKIKKTILLLIFSMLYSMSCSPASDNAARVRQKFNNDWKFSKGDFEKASTIEFDDSGWRALNLPHDWAIEGPFSKVILSGNWQQSGDEYFLDGQGPRLTFTIETKAGTVTLNNP